MKKPTMAVISSLLLLVLFTSSGDSSLVLDDGGNPQLSVEVLAGTNLTVSISVSDAEALAMDSASAAAEFVAEKVTPYYGRVNLDSIVMGGYAAVCNLAFATEVAAAMELIQGALKAADILNISVVSYQYDKDPSAAAPSPFVVPYRHFQPAMIKPSLTPARIAAVLLGTRVAGGLVGTAITLFMKRSSKNVGLVL